MGVGSTKRGMGSIRQGLRTTSSLALAPCSAGRRCHPREDRAVKRSGNKDNFACKGAKCRPGP
eukprot:scaffold33108_cov129-Isochrysis_galbana.AAC.1